MSRPAGQVMREGSARLAEAGTASPMAEARTLLSHVLHREPRDLVLATVDDDQAAAFSALLDSRVAGIPVQHLTGEAWFRTVRLEVGPGVFVPRPETEVMVGWGLQRIAAVEAPVVVELCAGSGAISRAIAAEHSGARQFAVELDPAAHQWASRNLADTDVQLVLGDMADAFPELDGGVDLVIANPPYIPLEAWESVAPDVRDHDPALALWSGDDGLDATRVVAAVARRLLRPGGWVCSEHAEVQEHSAPEVFVREGDFDQVRDLPDLAGRPRFVTARRR